MLFNLRLIKRLLTLFFIDNAKKAIEALNGKEYRGRTVKVNEALPKHIVETLNQSKDYVKAVERAEELLNG